MLTDSLVNINCLETLNVSLQNLNGWDLAFYSALHTEGVRSHFLRFTEIMSGHSYKSGKARPWRAYRTYGRASILFCKIIFYLSLGDGSLNSWSHFAVAERGNGSNWIEFLIYLLSLYLSYFLDTFSSGENFYVSICS